MRDISNLEAMEYLNLLEGEVVHLNFSYTKSYLCAEAIYNLRNYLEIKKLEEQKPKEMAQ